MRRAAERFPVSVPTAQRWAARYRQLGPAGMVDRPCRPVSSPRRTPQRVERRIIKLRWLRRWGPARIGHHLGLHPSTVHKVLARYRMARLDWLDRATGRVVRRVVRRYEHDAPGDLVHVDVKKLGRVPDGGGHKMVGRAAGRKNTRPGRIGYWYLHNAVDDHSRLAYSEICSDECQETAAAFWGRAQGVLRRPWHHRPAGVNRQRLLLPVAAVRRRPGRGGAQMDPALPTPDQWVERFNRTLLDEWACACLYRSAAARLAAFAPWLHHYNHHRGHTSLGGKPPISRLAVIDLCGQNS